MDFVNIFQQSFFLLTVCEKFLLVCAGYEQVCPDEECSVLDTHEQVSLSLLKTFVSSPETGLSVVNHS